MVFVFDVKIDVMVVRFEDSDFVVYVVVRNDIRVIDEGSINVGENVIVEVRYDYDVELLRVGNSLYGGIVDNYVVDFKGRVFFGDLVEGVVE